MISDTYIKGRIAQESYFVPPGSGVTLCTIVLDTGYSVTGKSSVTLPIDYNKKKGETIAWQRAIAQLKAMFSFHRLEKQREKPILEQTPFSGTSAYISAIMRKPSDVLAPQLTFDWELLLVARQDKSIEDVDEFVESLPYEVSDHELEAIRMAAFIADWFIAERDNPEKDLRELCAAIYREFYLPACVHGVELDDLMDELDAFMNDSYRHGPKGDTPYEIIDAILSHG